MTRRVHEWLSRLSVLTLLLVATTNVFAAPPALVPLPQMMQTNVGTFTLSPSQVTPGLAAFATTKILVDEESRENGEYLSALLFKSTGFRFEIATNSGELAIPQAILLTTNTALTNLGTEGYELTVTTNAVVVRAPTSAGVFYGIQSLLQLLPPEILSSRPLTNIQWKVPCVYIQDQPRFPWRGWMLDSVRHFFTKDEVKVLLDGMALNKLNMFHWHLDDDSGWRIEIKKYPLLTQVGAWRDWTNSLGTNLWGLNPRSTEAYNDIGQYGGYYSQADIREIVAYAAQRHITIVPEIEMPGHSTAALSAYPQFSCDGGVGSCPTCLNVPHSLSVTSYSGGVFCIARPETMTFIQDVLTEVMTLFPGPYIHIGGDEVIFSNWNRHSLDRAATNALGISSMQKYQSHFTQQVTDWIKGQGRQMVGWSEIMNGGLVTNAVLMDWITGTGSRAQQAATNGQYVVMTPTSTCYINEWETGSASGNGGGVVWSNEPPAQSGFVPLTNVYNFEPIPSNLAPQFTNFILGPQGNTWSEWIPSFQNMAFRTYPRLCALAEVGWTRAELKNFNSFSNRLTVQKQRLTQLGINYNNSTTPPELGTWDPSVLLTTNFATLQWSITPKITSPGEIDVSFCWKSGANGLQIAWVALFENGVEIDRDTHSGFTGAAPVKPAYVLRLPALRPNAIYTLRASVAGRGGTDSTGVIYRPNWN